MDEDNEQIPAAGEARLKRILEAGLLVAGRPLSLSELEALFGEGADVPSRDRIRQALLALDQDWRDGCLALQEVASGFRAQVRGEFEPWIARLWDDKPPRYSRALLETLAIIAYRQPMTRSEVEDIRGVSVSSNIIRTLSEREWVRVVGHRETPGRPAMYATTRAFLDYFNLKDLDELPSLAELSEPSEASPQLDLESGPEAGEPAAEAGADGAAAEAPASGAAMETAEWPEEGPEGEAGEASAATPPE